MNNNFPPQVMIAITEAKNAVDRDGSVDIIDKLKVAMSATRNHWMCTDESEQLTAAVGGVMLHYGEGSDEFSRLEIEMKALRKLNAVLTSARAGVSVNLEHSLPDPDIEYIGIMKLWHANK